MSKNHNIKASYILLKPTKKKGEVGGYKLFEMSLLDENQKEVVAPIEIEGTHLQLPDIVSKFSRIKIDFTKEGYFRIFSGDIDFLYSAFSKDIEIRAKN